jgi:hypothetical protein
VLGHLGCSLPDSGRSRGVADQEFWSINCISSIAPDITPMKVSSIVAAILQPRCGAAR